MLQSLFKKTGMFGVLIGTVLCAQAQTDESQTVEPKTAEDYAFIAEDGAWCWFSDPRAIAVRGSAEGAGKVSSDKESSDKGSSGDKIVGGYVDGKGTIWSFTYDLATKDSTLTPLHEKLNQDDHANPSFIELPDKRIATFYSAHGGTKNSPIYYRITQKPGDTSAWDDECQIKPNIEGPMGNCYTNPAILSAEGNRLYLFFRGSDFKPNMVYTDDMKTWSAPKRLITDPEGSNYVRPYLKSCNNGKDSIFFAFTDGHPRNELTNSIYFLKYKGGKLYAADGREVGTLEGDAVTPRQCDVVYDATKTGDKAWIWDVAYDKDENPVIVYARFSHASSEHSYWYARWNGKEWQNTKLCSGGRHFQRPDPPKEKMEYENNYSGGLYLDHENPDVVYVSRPINNVFEIEQYVTSDRGKTWTSSPVTQGSTLDNVRPFVVRGHAPDSPCVLWMYNYAYPAFTDYRCAIRINDPAKPASSSLSAPDVTAIGNKVADWTMEHFTRLPASKDPASWLNAALYLGMNAWAQTADNKACEDWLIKRFNTLGWQPAPRLYHADDIAVSQVYIDLYRKHKKDRMLTPTRIRTDWVVANPSDGSLDCDYSKPTSLDRWSWCDALFMAPPVYAQLYAVTGDKKYMDFADKEFKATTDYLYDKDEHLYFRDSRYFPDKQKEANGKKIFWGRGNGWVIAGLAKILDTLPKDDKAYRPYYEKIFVELAEKLASLQGKDGYWHASLLDPDSYPNPETSATGFITYGLAYAVNNGYLPKDKYLPVIEKGWDALVRAVDTEGRLGWVQPVGADPKKVTKAHIDVYGMGAFLLAASEILKMDEKASASSAQ